LKAKGIYFLYRLLQALAWPALLFYFAVRAIRKRAYRRSLLQRWGILPHQLVQTVPGCIWLHAVSVGEILAAVEVIRRLRRELPGIPVMVSAGTVAGRTIAQEKLFGLAEVIFYAPLDYVAAVRGTLKAILPSVVVVLETEIWPNLFREVRRTGAAVVMINGRISDKTARSYAQMRWFFGPVLAQASRILVQSEADRARFLAAGAPPETVETGGNLKYDFEPREAPVNSPVRSWLAGHAGKRVWIAASTTSDGKVAEEDFVLDAFAELPDWVLILAPRKPDRFAEVAQKLSVRKLSFVRRTNMDDADLAANILLLDTIGELAGLFVLADVVFMGGSLSDRGGHNILEPAFFGKPVITGPHMENFREIAADFREHDAVITIDRPEALANAVKNADPRVGHRGRERASAKRGATDYAVSVIKELHARSIPQRPPMLAARVFFAPVAWIWERVATRPVREVKRLDVPVISVGNITAGGTGKTPFVAWLAARLAAQRHRPGILTRGYGRRSHQSVLALPAGVRAPVCQTGDEPQIFLRRGHAALGVGSDRYQTGAALRKQFDCDMFLLDDGFQHRKLARDLDIVLIDGLLPFGTGRLLPIGRLREPLTGLRRADAFVITRMERTRMADAIERRLKEYNPEAPVFHAATIAERWVEFTNGHESDSVDFTRERVIAFCGLGNPASFWQTLSSLGIYPVDTVEYGDHHSYSPAEVRRLAQLADDLRATTLLTTEKDAINLFEGAASLLRGVRLFWLRIDLRIDDEAGLLDLVASATTPHLCR
jgi:tetraacyldisaccharide 4'-kinase